MSRPLDRRRLALLSVGHGCADLCQGAVPALLPFLVARDGLSLASAAALLSAATIGSSLVQPLFGIWTDRLSSPVLLPAGVALGGVGLGAIRVRRLLRAAGVCVVGGLGVAAFHPEAARLAGYVSGSERARGMSYFSVGGNAGFALGPRVRCAAGRAVRAGRLAAARRARPRRRRPARAELPRLRAVAAATAGSAAHHAPRWGAFSRLTAAAVARTVAFFALQAFVPLYAIEQLRRLAGRRRRAARGDARRRRGGNADRRPAGRPRRPARRDGLGDGAARAAARRAAPPGSRGVRARARRDRARDRRPVLRHGRVRAGAACQDAPGSRRASRSVRRSASAGCSRRRSARLRTRRRSPPCCELLPLFALAALALSLSLPGPRQLRTAAPSGS